MAGTKGTKQICTSSCPAIVRILCWGIPIDVPLSFLRVKDEENKIKINLIRKRKREKMQSHDNVLGSRVNASHRRVHTLCGELSEQLEILTQMVNFQASDLVRLESKACHCGESSSGLVSSIYPDSLTFD